MAGSLVMMGTCDICGKLAELEKVKGYDFKMCPHCAYASKVHKQEH
jgi:hypothetical protein